MISRMVGIGGSRLPLPGLTIMPLYRMNRDISVAVDVAVDVFGYFLKSIFRQKHLDRRKPM